MKGNDSVLEKIYTDNQSKFNILNNSHNNDQKNKLSGTNQSSSKKNLLKDSFINSSIKKTPGSFINKDSGFNSEKEDDEIDAE